ncbi:MAG TPA: 50S ribosomal protein L29 [Gemmatimonadales bacterium]|jgi:large subunit ribosomal protein L29|nr:50S ribosomal protein L29 [Gemmatimonadales bacterium]
MAHQRPDDLRQLKTEELEQKLAVLREDRFRLRFRAGTEAITNPLQFRTMRRDIARIVTILHERAAAGKGSQA